MNQNNKPENRPQPQTADNPTGESIPNPFENNQSVESDIRDAEDKLDQEQQFKEVQTERD